MSSLQEKLRWRLAFLQQLYDKADGLEDVRPVDIFEIGRDAGIPNDQVLAVEQYLQNEGLLHPYGAGSIVVLTHRGVLEVEQTMQHPERDTEHFPSSVIVNVAGDIIDSQLQVATRDSEQSGTFISSSQVQEVAAWLSAIRNQLGTLPAEQRFELEAQLATGEAQLKSRKPNRAVLRITVSAIRALLMPAIQTVSSEAARDALNHLIQNLPKF